MALGDNTGTLQTQYTYEPFGPTTQTGPASTNSYKFTGREDDGTGLYYYRARYYQPRLQRFIAEDPLGFGVETSMCMPMSRIIHIDLSIPWGGKRKIGCVNPRKIRYAFYRLSRVMSSTRMRLLALSEYNLLIQGEGASYPQIPWLQSVASEYRKHFGASK